MKIWAQVSFVLSQSMRLTDRETDGRTPDRNAFAIPCVALHAVACKNQMKSIHYIIDGISRIRMYC